MLIKYFMIGVVWYDCVCYINENNIRVIFVFIVFVNFKNWIFVYNIF